MLTKFFKNDLFLCLPKVDHVNNYCKRSIKRTNIFPAITVDRRDIYRWRRVTTDRPKKTSTSELTSYLYTNATSLLLILNKTTDQ